MILHANRWREVQRDMAIIMCELGYCHLSTGETSVGKTGRKKGFILKFYLKTISGKKNKLREFSTNI